MATLADVNQQLLVQNESLDNVDKGITRLSDSLSTFVSNLSKNESLEKLNDLERSREEQFRDIKVETEKSKSIEKASGSGLFGGLLGSLAQLFTVGGLAGAAATIFTGALKRVPLLILNALADDIANYIGEEFDMTGESRLALRNALKLGTLGALINKRFAAIGFAVGLFWNKEAEAAFQDLFDKFEELKTKYAPEFDQIRKDLAEYGINLDLLLNPLEAIASGLKSGLEGVDQLLSGEAFKSMENAGEFATNVGGLVASLVGIYALLRPIAALGLLVKAGKLGGAGLKKALTFVFAAGSADAALDVLSDAGVPVDTTKPGEKPGEKPDDKTKTQPKGKPRGRMSGRVGVLGALGLGLSTFFYSPELGDAELPDPNNPDYKFLDQLENQKQSENIVKRQIDRAEILAKEADIRVELQSGGGSSPTVVQDNSSTIVGGGTTNSMVLPPSPASDIRDPRSRD